jgi:hypothetical protein
VRGLSLGLSRPLRETLSLNLYASIDRREYLLDARKDQDSLVGLALRWQWLRNLEVEFGASRARRSSDLASQAFEENRYLPGHPVSTRLSRAARPLALSQRDQSGSPAAVAAYLPLRIRAGAPEP